MLFAALCQDIQRSFRVSSGGTEVGTVKTRSDGFLRFWMAWTNISMACPVFGGTNTVAVSRPLRIQACPVFGRPSHPRKGSLSQRSRSASLDDSSKALRAPMAMESSCAETKSTGALCEVLSFNQERTARCELSSVHWALSAMIWTLAGLASCIPRVRSFAAEFSEGP